MSWHDARTYFLIAVIIYGCSAVYSIFLWRKGFRRHDHVNYFLLLAGIIFHTRAMMMRGLSLQRCPVNNLYEAMTFVAWTIAAAYLVFGLFPRLRHFGSFVAPIVFGIGVFALMPALDVPYKDKPEFRNGLVSLHAALSLLSYGAFGLSAVAALMYLTLEHDLKFHKLRALLALLPPIDRLEKITSRLLWAGFILLTAGLAFIPFLLKERPETNLAFDPKVPWSALVWLLYLGLLVWHSRFAQTGRRFAWGAIGTFAFVLLTFWGVNLLSPTHKF
ncbi:MAG: cytochrome c biogenesis protein CcsA [Verrucomicrobiota bacterium]